MANKKKVRNNSLVFIERWLTAGTLCETGACVRLMVRRTEQAHRVASHRIACLPLMRIRAQKEKEKLQTTRHPPSFPGAAVCAFAAIFTGKKGEKGRELHGNRCNAEILFK